MPSTIILSGAPTFRSLSWEPETLLDDYIAPIARFAGLEDASSRSISRTDGETDGSKPNISNDDAPKAAAWRYLPLYPQHLTTGFSQIHDFAGGLYEGGQADFFSTANYSASTSGSCFRESFDHGAFSECGSQNDETVSQFYQESFAIHEDATPCSSVSTDANEPASASASASASSSILPPGSRITSSDVTSSHSQGSSTNIASQEESPELTSNSASFQISSYSSSRNSFVSTATKSPPPPPPPNVPLTTLSSIPSARYLNHLSLQIITVNLVVGLISIPSSPRVITTRRGDIVQLLEVLAGDDNRAGFSVNFWLPGPSNAHGPGTRGVGASRTSYRSRQDEEGGRLAKSLVGLRPRDVVLLRNVALASFKGRVYGQSLRGGWTTVQLLYRTPLDRDDDVGCYNARDMERGGESELLNDRGGVDEGDGNGGDDEESSRNEMLVRVRRVREWVLQFVSAGANTVRRTEDGRVETLGEVMPADTQ